MNDFPLQLDLDNPEFQQAFQLLTQTSVNVFLTGKAGTGKSTFLRYICQKIRKNYIILAPTGVAAVNVGGVTIHSFFQMPLRPVPPDDPEYSVKTFRNSNKLSRQKKKIIKSLDLIIIDEVSMVRPDMIDFIDRALRGIRGKRGVPFGGVQLLLVGDIFQLEPVVTSDTRAILGRYYPEFFFFNALAYQQVRLIAIELKKMYRQSDSSFIKLLDRVRVNSITDDDLALLNSKIDTSQTISSGEDENFSIVLASRRDSVTAINSERMAALEGEEKTYEGEIEDDFPEKILPTDMLLTLKVGAQVMMVRNDKDKRWVNGTLAKVTELGTDHITVELENGDMEKVEREIWENISYTYDEKEKKVVEQVIGRFSQFPLKAAWALTIHKSQGLTFSNVSIDMGGGAFTAGQTYVALSRCRSLDGLHFLNPLRRYDVMVSRGATEFSKRFNDTKAAEEAMRDAAVERLSQKAKSAFESGEMLAAVEYLWEIHNLSGRLANKGVRRLIAKTLSVISRLRQKIQKQHIQLQEASNDICQAAEIILKDLKNPEEAKKLYKKAIDIDATNSTAMMALAQILRVMDNTENAIIMLDKVIKLRDSSIVEASIMKGDILAQEGDLAGAALQYQNAAKKAKKNKDVPIRRLIKLYEDADMEEVAEQWKLWLD
ncbi:MAG: AAA family ATPase [Muribaculaceae bacterium]|nr:AAA family ATPase [Muribaculaceae bacterium]